ATEQPLEENLAVGHLEVEDDVEVAPELTQQLVERLRLRHRPRETVQDEASHCVPAREPVPDELDHQLGVDEFASVEHCSQVAWLKWNCAMKMEGATATDARKSAPGNVSRLRTRSK